MVCYINGSARMIGLVGFSFSGRKAGVGWVVFSCTLEYIGVVLVWITTQLAGLSAILVRN
jgi:hypothetical protein